MLGVLLDEHQGQAVLLEEIFGGVLVDGSGQFLDGEDVVDFLVAVDLDFDGLLLELDIYFVGSHLVPDAIQQEVYPNSVTWYLTLLPSWSHEYLVRGVKVTFFSGFFSSVRMTFLGSVLTGCRL